MLILLPPSEAKAIGRRGRPLDRSTLSFPTLTPVRERVAEVLAEASTRPDAHALLGVGPSLSAEVGRNTRLASAAALPAEQLYTGVLYDALDLAGLDGAARRRARRWIVIVSALYGAARLTDRLAPYRLAMDARLPELPSLAFTWRGPLDAALRPAVGRGLVVDARSGPYVAAWPAPADLADRWVQVRVPGASHFAKHTRGLVARAICLRGLDPRTPADLAEGLADAFAVALHEPDRAGKAWILDVTPPPAAAQASSRR